MHKSVSVTWHVVIGLKCHIILCGTSVINSTVTWASETAQSSRYQKLYRGGRPQVRAGQGCLDHSLCLLMQMLTGSNPKLLTAPLYN